MPSVMVIAGDADRRFAGVLEEGLAKLGYSLVDQEWAAERVVVILSRRALEDSDFFDRATVDGATPVLPVAVEDVGGLQLPAGLAELNWVWWDHDQPHSAARTVSSALITDQPTYAASRIVEAKAWAWVASGRGTDELLTSRRQVVDAERSTDAESGRGAAHPVITAFLAASRDHARSVLRRRVSRVVLASIFTGLVITAALGLVSEIKTVVTRSQLAPAAGVDSYQNGFAAPDNLAVKTAAYMIASAEQGDDQVGTPVAANLSALLSQPWPLARVSAPDGAGANDLATFGEGAWLVRGDGQLQLLDSQFGKAVSSIEASSDPLYSVATSSDGDVVLATGDRGATLIRDGALVGTVSMAEYPTAVAVSADGSRGAVQFGESVAILTLEGPAPVIVETRTWDEVLDIRAGSDSLVGLVRDGSGLATVALGSDEALWSAPLPASSRGFLFGAVGEDGSAAIVTGRRLWTSRGQGELDPVGPAPDAATAMAISDGMIAVSSDPYGTTVFDATLGITLPRTCRGFARVLDVTFSARNDTVTCDGYGVFETWPIQRPVPSSDRRLATITPAEAEAVLDRLPARVDLSGDVTAVAGLGSSNTVVVGTSDGEVVEFDTRAEGRGFLAGRWQMADETPVVSLTYESTEELAVQTESALWTLRPCPGCGGSSARQVSEVTSRPKRCYGPDLTTLIPPELLDRLRVSLCRGTL